MANWLLDCTSFGEDAPPVCPVFNHVTIRTSVPGVLPAVSSFSITSPLGADWTLNGVIIPGTHTICQGVDGCECIAAGTVAYDPRGGELLISYLECPTT